MNLNSVNRFFRKLEDQLHELEIETTYLEGLRGPQIGDTLRILLPITDEGHPVLTEIMVTEFTDDLDLLHIYTTLIVKSTDNISELPGKLSEWNILCPLGAYGIYEEDGERQLFHKYTLPINRDSDEELADEAMLFIELIHGILSEKYPEFSEYSMR